MEKVLKKSDEEHVHTKMAATLFTFCCYHFCSRLSILKFFK